MKKFLLSTVALATMTAGAIAADLPARRMAPAPYVAVPVFTWTGFYVGANIGAGWNEGRRDDFLFGNNLVATGGGAVVDAAGNNFGQGFGLGRDRDRTSILGGVQAGYNWQMGSFVLGVEGDIQAIGNNNNRNDFGFFGGNNGFGTAVVTNAGPFPANAGVGVAAPVVGAGGNNVAFFNNNGFGGVGNGDRDWFATARLRAGFAVDRALFYVTGGLAYTDDDDNNRGFFGGGFGGVGAIPAPFFVAGGAAAAAGVGPTNAVFFNDRDRNNWGWALGLGMEYAFTNNLSAKIEYLHVAFDRDRNHWGANNVVGVTNTGAAITSTGAFNNRRRNDIDLVRVGLNFRFSGF